MSKRSRPADPRQPDLFGAPPAEPASGDATPCAGEPAAPPASGPPDPIDPPAQGSAPAGREAGDSFGPGLRFHRVDATTFRGADRPDRYLYAVVSREVGDAIARHGLDGSGNPPLVERPDVPRQVALVADELACLDEPLAAIDVLRVRRGEVEAARESLAPDGLAPRRRAG